MPFLEPVSLRGTYARLEPLSPDHHDALVEAVADGELSKLWYTAIPSPEGMAKEIARRLGLLTAGTMLPFTVFDADGKIAGMTTYMNVDANNRRVEIGSTWYAKRVQRSALNTQCKRLLLAHQIAPNGTLRDTVVYSIIASEWPTVQAHLDFQLNDKPR
jgi:N-acetyltransferase